ncbi:MAG: dihydroneopterin aldolase [Chloroflexota bacterium]
MDEIALRGMRFQGRHGAEPDERLEPQPFEVDVVMRLDLHPAGESDELARTIDYSIAFEIARRVVEEESFRLIETIAEMVARDLFAELAVDELEVRVRKPKAPLPGAFETVEATIRRRRSERPDVPPA